MYLHFHPTDIPFQIPIKNGNMLNPTTTFLSPEPPKYYPSPSSIVVPSDVLPNTAISDRPKMKSVSKKDNKISRKASVITSTPALKNNQTVFKKIN